MPVSTLVIKPDGSLVRDLGLREAAEFHSDPAARLWVDLLEPGMEDYDLIRTAFGFHPLALEDCHHTIQRPKVDDYGENLFLVFHGLNLNEGADPLDMLELDSFLGSNFLVTIRYGRLFSIREIMDRIAKNPELLRKGPDFVYYAVVDRMVDYYFDLMDRLDEEVDALEERLLTRADRESLHRILDLKRRIMALRRVAGPQREIMNQLARGDYPLIQEQHRYYFRDVYDHLLRIADSLDAFRDMVGSAMDTYLSQISNRTNDIMKVLSIIATIMLPLSLITGYFGMNFQVMPWLHDPHAIYVLTGLMVLLAGLMLAYFRKKGWM